MNGDAPGGQSLIVACTQPACLLVLPVMRQILSRDESWLRSTKHLFNPFTSHA